MAAMSRNLGKLQDAEKYIKEALRYLDGMTERERYNARGMLYIGDRRLSAVREGIRGSGRPIRSRRCTRAISSRLCSTHLRDMRKAVEEMREVVKIAVQAGDLPGQPRTVRVLCGRFPERGTRGTDSPGPREPFGLAPLGLCPAGTGPTISGQ